MKKATWYKPGEVWLEKDLILPYVSNVEICNAKCLSGSESSRTTLLFVHGRLKRNAEGKIRAKLVAEFDSAEASGCILVVINDELELPFEGILDYRKIVLFVSSSDAIQPGWLMAFLKNIGSKKIREMRVNLAKCARYFLYSSHAQPLGLEDLAWRMIADGTNRLHPFSSENIFFVHSGNKRNNRHMNDINLKIVVEYMEMELQNEVDVLVGHYQH
ncbi:hypothetical protein GIB67_038097 [Kingdonia uniflora]|uniref:Uncharacterized protein n=1 Tax=Kingdonia uniflora TaxID=39325 RepID=A0A7J7P870_9MAGN|nr:hypothetical protein GIB67_038097 [Kingdonia uniflora]